MSLLINPSGGSDSCSVLGRASVGSAVSLCRTVQQMGELRPDIYCFYKWNFPPHCNGTPGILLICLIKHFHNHLHDLYVCAGVCTHSSGNVHI